MYADYYCYYFCRARICFFVCARFCFRSAANVRICAFTSTVDFCQYATDSPPYNGSTTWTSFRDHFGRVAKVNRWEDDVTKAQHLMLALEGEAAELLKEISDTIPTVLQDIWDALSCRFGEIDEARESMRKFQQRRQSYTESVVEFQQALRSLYRLAWPNATVEQKEVALKTRFEDGLINQEMQQYLRLHAMGDTFGNTVQKARRFAATIDVLKSRKSVRISTPPSHEVVQLIQEDTSLNKRMENLEKIMKSLQATAQENKNAQSACVSDKPQRQFQPSRNAGAGQNNARRQFVQPFNANIQQPRRT